MPYVMKEETLNGIADAIRLKTGTEYDIQAEDFEEAILGIQTCENTDIAKESAFSAAQSAREADESAISARSSALAASESAGIVIEYTETAKTKAEAAQNHERNAEAYAVGTRNGVPVSEGDIAYQNNAKYYAEYFTGIDYILFTANVFAEAVITE